MVRKEKTPKRELTRLEKKYKGLRWTQHILFWLSILAATVPGAVAVLKTGVVYKTESEKWSISGFVVFIIAVSAILMVSGLRDKFRDKLPWAMKAVVGSWVMFVFIWIIKSIIEDAYIISLVLAIGCTVAAVLGSISNLCEAQADSLEAEYNRRSE